ncbi:MAG TPA: nickel-binding protein [Gaiellaceae bacterium]|nr:nickel-binding protein [Gaiellaceae bacterium]
MASYLVEAYVPRGRPKELEAAAGRAREAAARLTEEGLRIRFLRSTFVPDDELCFLIFEAESRALVAEAASRAAIEYERILEAIE